MDSRLWKIGFFTTLTSFVLMILGVRTILGYELVIKNYLAFGIFSITIGILSALLLFYQLKVAYRVFLGALILGFLEFFRSILMDTEGMGDVLAILSLFIISSFGFGLAMIIQFTVTAIKRNRETD